jgi:probable HAF family extracellular repeat protein
MSLGRHRPATSFANGINNKGQIVGIYIDSNRNQYGFLYNTNSGTYATINYPSAIYTTPMGINDNGQIVGYYGDSSMGAHGFLYDPITGTLLPSTFPNGGTSSEQRIERRCR